MIALGASGCGDRATSASSKVDAWARELLTRPTDAICDGPVQADYFCRVKDSLVPDEVRALGVRTITLQGVRGVDRYVDLDRGGGHVAAHGLLIGPPGWTHEADPERGERPVRDGVFAYDTRR